MKKRALSTAFLFFIVPAYAVVSEENGFIQKNASAWHEASPKKQFIIEHTTALELDKKVPQTDAAMDRMLEGLGESWAGYLDEADQMKSKEHWFAANCLAIIIGLRASKKPLQDTDLYSHQTELLTQEKFADMIKDTFQGQITIRKEEHFAFLPNTPLPDKETLSNHLSKIDCNIRFSKRDTPENAYKMYTAFQHVTQQEKEKASLLPSLPMNETELEAQFLKNRIQK